MPDACGDKKGTVSGYSRHYRNGEWACPACSRANADYARAWRASVKVEAEHGTNAGYAAHVRNSHPPCQACRDAHAAASRAWREARGLTPGGRKTK